jgi:hypothetical protein
MAVAPSTHRRPTNYFARRQGFNRITDFMSRQRPFSFLRLGDMDLRFSDCIASVALDVEERNAVGSPCKLGTSAELHRFMFLAALVIRRGMTDSNANWTMLRHWLFCARRIDARNSRHQISEGGRLSNG